MKMLKVVFMAAAVCLFAGCKTEVAETSAPATEKTQDGSITIDNALQEDLDFNGYHPWTTVDGKKGVVFRGRMRHDSLYDWVFHSYTPYVFAYHVEYAASNGSEVVFNGTEDYSWQVLTVYPGEEIIIASLAPSQNVDIVKLVIRKDIPADAVVEPVKDNDSELKKDILGQELPESVLQGKTTTTQDIDKTNKDINKEDDKLVEEKRVEPADEYKPCKCGCLDGETCLCPDTCDCKMNHKEIKE